MASTFRNRGVVKVAVGFAVGGFAGWLVNEEISGRKCNRGNKRANEDKDNRSLQKMLASSWTNLYTPTSWDSNWDRRDPSSLINPKLAKSSDVTNQNAVDINNNSNGKEKENKRKISPTRHLLLIRHGQYNLKGDGDTQRFLTELGCQQADLTGLRLQELKLPYKMIIHSTMTRARETANHIHKHLEEVPMVENSMLEEGAPFPPEPPLSSWKPDHKQFYDDGARIEAAFRKYFHRPDQNQLGDSYEVIVCHANVIRYFVCRALQLPPEAWLRMSLRHGSITWITIASSGRVALRALGDSGYMPPDKITVT